MKRTPISHLLSLGALLLGLSACGQPPDVAPLTAARDAAISDAAAPTVASQNLLGLADPAMSFKLYDLHGQGPPVFLVHGYMGSHLDEQDIGEALVAHGYAAYTIDIQPSDASVAQTANEVEQAADEIMAQRGTNQIFLAGHSMGGLAERYYLDFLGGAAHVKALVTISTPHHGTLDAYLAHGGARADLMLNSALTKKLNAVPEPVPTLSIYSETDQVVVPFFSAHLDGAQNMPLCCYTHSSILHSQGVMVDIEHYFDGFSR